MRIDDLKNRWVNTDYPLIEYLVNFNVKSDKAIDFIYILSCAFIEYATKYQLLVFRPVELKNNPKSELQEFKTYFDTCIFGKTEIPSFLSRGRSIIHKNTNGELPFINYLSYYDLNGSIIENYTLMLKKHLRKWNIQPEAITFNEIIDSPNTVEIYHPFQPLTIKPYTKNIRFEDLTKETIDITFGITVHSDIWFDNHKFLTDDNLKNPSTFKNEELYFKNTTRLNSLLRDLKKLFTNLNGNWVAMAEGAEDGKEDGSIFQSIIRMTHTKDYSIIENDFLIPYNGKIHFKK